MTDDLIPTVSEGRRNDKKELETVQDCMEQVEIAFSCINELDWQVTKSKHVINKYKDLVVKL